jgi:hypothetical protein
MSVRRLRRGFVLALLAVGSAPLSAGPLLPPAGPIASTMKTLAEVEPRIAINSVNTPGNSSAMFRITQPGSYYLTENLTVNPNMAGIQILTHTVTIDLNCYRISGTGGINSLQNGIEMSGPGAAGRVVIRNGTISGMSANGIRLTNNSSTFPSQHLIENVIITDSGQSGIALNDGVIRNCQIDGSAGSGILTTSNFELLVEKCIISTNTINGINASRATVLDSTVSRNGAAGIRIGRGIVRGCTLTSNTQGVFLSDGGPAFGVIVEDNLMCDNAAGVVAAGINSMIRRNVIRADGVRQQDGISLTGTGHTVEDNMIVFKQHGIRATNTGNLIRRNTVIVCNTPFSIVAFNRVGVIVIPPSSAPIVGSSGGGLGTTDPNANIVY